MVYFRVIPIILVDGESCYKTIKFKKKIYLGDPLNIIKIYNDLEVDELVIFDISKKSQIDFNLLSKLSRASFVPLTYGGKINEIDDIENVINLGFEKISINNLAIENLPLVEKCISKFGSSTVSVSVNLKKNFFGKYKIYNHRQKKLLKIEYQDYLKKIDRLKPGEILLSFVDNEGMKSGFDLDLIKDLKKITNSNLLINGGLKNFSEILQIKNLNLSGVAASRIFSFKDSLESILISYIDTETKKEIYEDTNICT